MKLFIIALISYSMDCYAITNKPMTRHDLHIYGQMAITQQTNLFVDETVAQIYSGVLAATTQPQKPGFIYKISPPNAVLLHSPINYIDSILEKIRVLFPDSEIEFRPGSGIGVYWSHPQTTPQLKAQPTHLPTPQSQRQEL